MTYPWVDSGCIGPSRLGIPSNYGKEAGSVMFTFRSLRLQDGPGPHQGLWFPFRLPEATPASQVWAEQRKWSFLSLHTQS